MPTFEIIAKDIIKETISNALFIDDKALEPYKSRSRKLHLRDDHIRSKQLYIDFKSNDCLLHVAKFTKKGWERDKNFNLNNKDLLILDWQLVGEDHQESLKILDQSVLKKGLHFCCIYTQASLEEVKNELNRFYLGKVEGLKLEEIRLLLQNTDLDEYWRLDITHQDWTVFEELINNIVNAKTDDIKQEVENFRDHYSLTPEIINQIEGIDASNIRSAFVKFKTILSKTTSHFTNISSSDLVFRCSKFDDHTLYINHTIVKLIEKDKVNGGQLYQAFFDSIMKEENIFLTLMGLEMRNRFRESSAFIGKDLDNVSEEAFFFHKNKNSDTPHIFIDFLKEILTDQVASFLYEKDLKIFNSLDQYSEEKGMPAKMAKFEGDSVEFKKQLFKLNKFYNVINISARKSNDSLRFGDVFKKVFTVNTNGTDVSTVKYFICITALCDCLRPEKINNQFWFVEGVEIVSQESALKKTDGKFISFLPSGDQIVAVDWKNAKEYCMPFGMIIKSNKINSGIEAKYYDENITLELVASLKENYAQRIANEAFGYPIRVGIDFVKKS